MTATPLLQGLETDPITRYVVARPPSSDWPRITAEQEAWAAQVGWAGQGMRLQAWRRLGGGMPRGWVRAGSGTL